jgi:pimeloyl-ACP methyl ester carboxylesterase
MLAIREDGAGDPIVLVHGAGTSSAIWHRAAPLLAERFRVVAPDVPGYGGSPAAGKGFALEEVTDDLVAGLEEAGVPPSYDLVGHSMGGAIAILLAARHPERVRRLVLVAPAGLAALPRVAAGLLGAIAAPFAHARRTLATPLAGSALCAGSRWPAWPATVRGSRPSTRAPCWPARPERRGSARGWPAPPPPTCAARSPA